MKNKASNKEILSAHGQSLKLLKEAKIHDDMLRKLEKKVGGKIVHVSHKQNFS